MIKEYRKTATIKAEQYQGTDEQNKRYNISIYPLGPYNLLNEHAYLPTVEGDMELNIGDWIATGVEGEHWAIKNSVFKKTYEPVQDTTDCPYCHSGSNLKSRYNSSAWDDDELNIDSIDDKTGKIDNRGRDMYADLSFNPRLKYLQSWAEGEDPLTVEISYCPFCGRKL